MPKKSFIKELLKRRIPHILGSYIIAGTSLVLFIDWLTVRYDFPQYYVTLALFIIISIIPLLYWLISIVHLARISGQQLRKSVSLQIFYLLQPCCLLALNMIIGK